MRYPFEKLFLVCSGPRCNDDKHGEDRGECIRSELKDFNKKMGRKPLVRVVGVTCLDLCDHGPNLVVDGDVFSHLTRKTAKAVYSGVMGDGPPRDDLQLDPEEFRAGTSSAKRG